MLSGKRRGGRDVGRSPQELPFSEDAKRVFEAALTVRPCSQLVLTCASATPSILTVKTPLISSRFSVASLCNRLDARCDGLLSCACALKWILC